jgi:signal transduction histidine kinase
MSSEATHTGSAEPPTRRAPDQIAGRQGRWWMQLMDDPLLPSEMIFRGSWWYAASIGILSATIALLARVPLFPVLNLHLPYLTFFCSSIIAAYLGGMRAGIIATALGGFFASYFFIIPFHYVAPTSAEHVVGMLIFVGISITVSVLFDSMHRERAKAARLTLSLQETEQKLLTLNRELEWRVEERTVALRGAQERDRANWQRLRSIIGHLSIGVLANDENGKVLEVNEEYCKLWNDELSPEKMVGEDIWRWSEVFRRYILGFERHRAVLQESSRRKTPLLGEVLHFTNGRLIMRDYLPIFESGKYIGEIYLYRDVTQERRADAFKSEFMSLASHQLRTPLTGIRWSLGRLNKELSGVLSERQLHLLRNGLGAAKRMSDTIDTMLLISQIESGSATLKHEFIEVLPFLKGLIADHEETIEEKQLDIRLEVPPEVSVVTDAHLLRELLANLISNSVKYTGAQGRVIIRVAHLDSHVRIDVRDTGFGIPLYQQKMIFTKFFRGENVVGRETEGTGLGLYLASLIAKDLSGTLTFESSVEGTVFTLILPERLGGDEPHGE